MHDRRETVLGKLKDIEHLDAAGLAHAMAVQLHEQAVAAGYDAALAGEPGLRCAEWERRNPFVESAAPGLADDATIHAQPLLVLDLKD
ncbi:MAG: hypothetical protein ACRYHQ_15940 [Janthinobacterium lividum]